MYLIIILILHLSIGWADVAHVLKSDIEEYHKNDMDDYFFTLPKISTELPYNSEQYLPTRLTNAYIPPAELKATKDNYKTLSRKYNYWRSKEDYMLPKDYLYLSPKKEYLAAKPQYLPSHTIDLPRKLEYTPPTTTSPLYLSQKTEYLQPKTKYSPPKIDYTLPSTSTSNHLYIPSKTNYYYTPSSTSGPLYLPPKTDYLPTKQKYLSSKADYTSPSTSRPLFFSPKTDYLPPKPKYLPPKLLTPKPLYLPSIKTDYLPPKTNYVSSGEDYKPPPTSRSLYIPPKRDYLPPKTKYLSSKPDYLPSSTSNSSYLPTNAEYLLPTTSKPYYKTLKKPLLISFTTIKPPTYLTNVTLSPFYLPPTKDRSLKDFYLPPKNVNYSYPIPNAVRLSHLKAPPIEHKSVYDNYKTDYVSTNLNKTEYTWESNYLTEPTLHDDYLPPTDSYLPPLQSNALSELSHDNYEYLPPIPIYTRKSSSNYQIPIPSYAASSAEDSREIVETQHNDGYHYDKPAKEFVY